MAFYAPRVTTRQVLRHALHLKHVETRAMWSSLIYEPGHLLPPQGASARLSKPPGGRSRLRPCLGEPNINGFSFAFEMTSAPDGRPQAVKGS